MGESELHAILDEIKNKGQVPEDINSQNEIGKKDFDDIIGSFNSQTKKEKVDSPATTNEKEKVKKKSTIFSRIKKAFSK